MVGDVVGGPGPSSRYQRATSMPSDSSARRRHRGSGVENAPAATPSLDHLADHLSISSPEQPDLGQVRLAQRRELVVHDPGGRVGERVVADEVLDQAAEPLDRVGGRRGRLGPARGSARGRPARSGGAAPPSTGGERRARRGSCRPRSRCRGWWCRGSPWPRRRPPPRRAGRVRASGLDAFACCRHRHRARWTCPAPLNHSKQALSHPAMSGHPRRRNACTDSQARRPSSPEPAAASGWASPSGWSPRARGSASPPASRRRWTRRSPPSAARTTRSPWPATPTTPTTGPRPSSARIEAFGSADLLVNNAGINPVYGPLIELDLDAARKIVEVNCLAALAWVQEAHRAWLAEHGGAVVNISSVAGVRPAPGIGIYGASKAMLISLTQDAGRRARPGIRVNAVAPAVVKTAVRHRRSTRAARSEVVLGVPAEAARRPRGHRAARSPSCSPTTRPGSPARLWSSTAASP